MNMLAHMSIVVVIALAITSVHMWAQKNTLWLFTNADIIANGSALQACRMYTLHTVSTWITSRHAPHNPFFCTCLLNKFTSKFKLHVHAHVACALTLTILDGI